MPDKANHIFLPWVQPGVAAALPDEAVERLDHHQPATITLPVKLAINAVPIEKKLRLYGPGDITGIDPQQIIRVEPRRLTTDFEPNYFPAIEFDRPDFPWLFTPAKADSQGRLRPWLCLIVVQKQPGVELFTAADRPLPVLEIKPPARPAAELPDLSESHFWAHAQVSGADRSKLKSTLESEPARTLSRLLCPRRLDPATAYIGCVVPAFEVGRRAGLNQLAEEDKLKPAWLSGADAPAEILLPVYYSWEFRTSAGGDFEELVRRLAPRELPAEAGKRPMSIARPGFRMEPEPNPDAPGTTLGLEGALRVVGSPVDEWADEARAPFQKALAEILNTPWEIATRADDDGETHDPIVAPPIYGCWHAAAHKVSTADGAPPAANESAPAPPWLNELNLDPRHRAIAAMGTRVVQEQQEQLMAAAWEQLGDIEKINQRLRQAQLSRAVNIRYHVKTFNRFSEETFVHIVAPAQSRIVLEEQQPNQPPTKTLLVQKLSGSFVPSTAVSAPLRKAVRPRGALNRKYARVGAVGVRAVVGFYNRPGVLTRRGPATQSRGAVTIDAVSDGVSGMITPAGHIWNPGPPGHWERVSARLVQMLARFRLSSMWGGTIQLPAANTDQFAAALKAHHDNLSQLFTAFIFADSRKVISTQTLKATLLMSLNPTRTVSQTVLDGVRINSPRPLTEDELDPVMDAPDFPQPMYEALRDLSQDYLFPGLEHVPPNTVQLLETNAKFIESFMVGLNAEMSRELLWRDYPTDQRGTYFRQFWDTTGAESARPDIMPIHEWRDRRLGTTAVAGAGGDKLVLLLRGELLRRYPGTIIYAAKAITHEGRRVPAIDHPGQGQAVPPLEAYPVFRGTLEPDVTFIGFDLTAAEVIAEPGWFFVLQQQPTEPRFGLDADPFGEGESQKIPELNTWGDLNWGHLAPDAEKLRELSHVRVGALDLAPTQTAKGDWGRNSAHMAYITKQIPARIAIHATELLP